MKSTPKNKHAQSLSAIRWDKSPKEERSAIARKAALKRWENADKATRLKNTSEALKAKLAKKAKKQG